MTERAVLKELSWPRYRMIDGKLRRQDETGAHWDVVDDHQANLLLERWQEQDHGEATRSPTGGTADPDQLQG